jgi:secreted trypsin-like serine protease
MGAIMKNFFIKAGLICLNLLTLTLVYKTAVLEEKLNHFFLEQEYAMDEVKPQFNMIEDYIALNEAVHQARGIASTLNTNGFNVDVNALMYKAKIAAGSKVVDTQLLKSVVKINFDSGGTCTGLLISNQVILTAAHCVYDFYNEKPVASNSATLTSSFLDKYKRPYQLGRSLNILIHENFDPESFSNDIALIIIKPVSSSIAAPIAKIQSPKNLKYKEKLTAIGYGLTEDENKNDFNLLMNSNIPYAAWNPTYVNYLTPSVINGKTIYNMIEVALDEKERMGKIATEEWSNTVTDSEGNITKVKVIGTCPGDSGGPLLKKVGSAYRIVGITSYGFSEFANSCGNASLYTSVNDFKSWITNTLKTKARIGISLTSFI